MSKFGCVCGEIVSNVTWPSTHEAKLVTDMEIDDLICSGEYKLPMKTRDDAGRHSRDIFECPSCFRIWIQVEYAKPKYLAFKPETEPLRLAEQQGGYRG